MIRDHLEEKGWLDKAYVYWFDEPSEKDYPFVKEGMELIRKAAPGLKRFLTEDSRPPDDFMQYLDISCPKISRVRPEEMFRSFKDYNKDPQYLLQYREKIAALLDMETR